MIDRFLDYLRYERNRSELTVLRYEKSLNDFETFFKNLPGELTWETVDADVIRDWLESLMDKGYKATSVNADLAALKSFYRFALARNYVGRDSVHCVRGPKKQKPLPQYVREQEMDKLLDQENWEDNYYDLRARTIILLLYEAGLRRAELVGLDDKDIDFGSRQLKVTGKRNKQRVIPFGEELEGELRNYMIVRDREISKSSDALLLDKHGQRMTAAMVYTEVRKQLGKVTMMKKRSPHVLRHSFATALLNHEAGLESVRRLLGHESLKTTEIYTHTTFEQLRRVYKEAHPRGTE